MCTNGSTRNGQETGQICLGMPTKARVLQLPRTIGKQDLPALGFGYRPEAWGVIGLHLDRFT